MTDSLKVLIVEDDPDVLLGCIQALQLEGIPAEGVGSVEAARKHLTPAFPGVVVSDIRLPKADGMSLLRDVQGIDPDLPVFLTLSAKLTGFS